MAAPKRTKGQRAADMAEMVRLVRRGHTQRDIAARLGIAASQVNYDWKQVLAELNADREKDVGKILAEYREIKAEAWAEWERSKKDREKELTEAQSDGKGKRTKATKSREGRLAEAEYLKVIQKCLEAERKLEGLDPAEKHEHSGPGGSPIQVVETIVRTRVDVAQLGHNGTASGFFGRNGAV